MKRWNYEKEETIVYRVAPEGYEPEYFENFEDILSSLEDIDVKVVKIDTIEKIILTLDEEEPDYSTYTVLPPVGDEEEMEAKM